LVYFVVFGIGIYYMLKLMHKGPQFLSSHSEEHADVDQTPMRPMSAVEESLAKLESIRENRHD
ncbi:cytochrome ubiquinol oxidase subunit I, partial [Acinetobacter baumannii]